MKTYILEKKPNTLFQGKTLGKSSGLSRGDRSLTKHATVGSTRLIGDKAEAQVAHVLKQSGLDVEATRNSGALKNDGDLVINLSDVDGDYIRAECKHRGTSGFTVTKKHWEQIKQKANKHGGIPALVIHNKDGDSLVVMNLNQLTTIIGAKDV